MTNFSANSEPGDNVSPCGQCQRPTGDPHLPPGIKVESRFDQTESKLIKVKIPLCPYTSDHFTHDSPGAENRARGRCLVIIFRKLAV